MAWNRSTAGGKTAVQSRRSKNSRSVVRGVVAGAIVVVGAALVWWLLAPNVEMQKPVADRKSNRIKEVKPAAAPTNKVETVEKKKEIVWAKHLKNAAIGPDGRPYYVPPPGRKVVTNKIAEVNEPYMIFKHHYQNELACYMTLKPGDSLMGDRHYSDRFVKEVVETMSLPIEDEETDTPEQRQLRQEMREAMKVLREQVDSGRDVREIFRETRRELQELSRYKRDLEMELRKIRKDETVSDDDVDIAIEAANKMLDAKGIAPIKPGKFSRALLKASVPAEKPAGSTPANVTTERKEN